MRFGVSYSADSASEDVVKKVRDALKSRGHSVELEAQTPLQKMAASIIFAVGDDANILRTFRELGEKEKPVLGVAVDAKSFLAEIDIDSLAPALKMIERKNYSIEKRSMLATEINGDKLPNALNEIVVSPATGTTIMRYGLMVDGELIFRDMADGIVISTPTGSTGYALSAGGPVISAKSNVFLAIPICSVNHNKPFVMNDRSTIVVSDISSRGKCDIVIDGRFRAEVDEDKVTIRKAGCGANFVRFDKDVHANVFRKLRSRELKADNVPKSAPPSAKYIYKILQYEGPMTQKEVAESSMLPARTARSALKYLLKAGLVSQQMSVRDTRQSIYFVS